MNRIFKLDRSAYKAFLPLFFLNFLLTSGFFLARVAKDALFYSKAGANNLPWAFILNAIVVFVIGGWLGRLQDRFPLKKMMLASWLISALCVLGFGLLFGFNVADRLGLIAYFSFFAFFEIPYVLLTALFWSFAEGSFTEREPDIVFPMLTGGAHLGTSLAGFLAIFATRYIGTTGLIMIWASMLVASFILIAWIWRHHQPKYLSEATNDISGQRKDDDDDPGIASGLQAVLKNRYAALFMFITFCTFFIMSIFDYVLADTSISVLGNDVDKLTVFLGYITAIFGLLAFFVQMIFVPRLINKLGIPNTNLIAPSLLTLAGGLLLIIYSFTVAAVCRGFFLINEFVFNQSLLPFIYGAVPERDRNKVRTTIEGTVTNVALAVAGIFLILPATVDNFPAHWIGLAAFLAALIMLILSIALRKKYNIIKGVYFDPDDSSGQLQHLESQYELGDDNLDPTLRSLLSSGSEANILLVLNFLKKYEYNNVFEHVLRLANDPSLSVRVAAIGTLEIIIQSNDDFDSFIDVIRFPKTFHGYSQFRKEDSNTLKAIASAYLKSGRKTQLGIDFLYFLEKDDYDPILQGLAAKLIIKESGSLNATRIAFEALEAALISTDIRKNIMAAEVVGEMGYGENNFLRLKNWTESDLDINILNVEPSIADIKLLQIVAFEAIIKIGVESSVAAEKTLEIALENLDIPHNCNKAVQGINRVLAAHPFLLSKINSKWNFIRNANIPISEAMAGLPTKLPQLITNSDHSDSEKILLEMLNIGEHQIAKEALNVLESKVHKNNCPISHSSKSIFKHFQRDILERICLCGYIRNNLNLIDKKHNFAYNSLSYRMEELFEQYCKIVWLTYRTPENALRIDRDIVNILSQKKRARDYSLKSLENIFVGNRNIYIEISQLTDALDSRIKEEDMHKILTEISKKENYKWVKGGIEKSIDRLFDIKPDIWLSWTLGSEHKVDRKTINDNIPYFDTIVTTLAQSQLFSNVPLELLGRLAFQSKEFNSLTGERLLYEGREDQGIFIIVEGETSIVIGNQILDSIPAPALWGEYHILARTPLEFGVRSFRTTVKGRYIEQEIFDSWINSHPYANKIIGSNLVKTIEILNKEESRLRYERGGMKQFTDKLQRLEQDVAQIIYPVSNRKSRLINRQKRFLISVEDIRLLESDESTTKNKFEQYYLIVEETMELRLRNLNNQVFKMTIKRKDDGEVTIPIEQKLFENMRKFQIGRSIRKTRYLYEKGIYKGWSVDVYDDNSEFCDLIIAEIILTNREDSLPEIPSYLMIQHDVSELSDLQNKHLALYGPPDFLSVIRWEN